MWRQTRIAAADESRSPDDNQMFPGTSAGAAAGYFLGGKCLMGLFSLIKCRLTARLITREMTWNIACWCNGEKNQNRFIERRDAAQNLPASPLKRLFTLLNYGLKKQPDQKSSRIFAQVLLEYEIKANYPLKHLFFFFEHLIPSFGSPGQQKPKQSLYFCLSCATFLIFLTALPPRYSHNNSA